MYTLNLVTPPAVEPVTLEQVKAHAYIDPDYTGDDALLSGLISSARQVCETMTNRAFISQTFEVTLDQFPAGGGYWNRSIRENPTAGWLPSNSGKIELPRPPYLSLTSVKHLDANGNEVTIDPSKYRVISGSESATYLTVAPGYIWPVAGAFPGAVRVRYVAGYGEDATSVPDGIKTAIKILVTTWYGQREALSDKAMSIVPLTVDTLLTPYVWGK